MTDTSPGGPEFIFIIEDDTALLNLIQKLLNRGGYQARGVSDGEKAVSMILDNPPQLLLLDYQLTKITAKAIIDTLSQKQCLPPFIVMTGHGNETIAVEMMKLGALDYIVKDNSFLDLLPSIIKKAIHSLTMEKKYLEAEKQRKKLEAQLVQSRKMEAIGTLAGGIAHDFNNILSAILGYAELVKEDLPEDTIANKNIGEVLKAALRAKDLVRRILTFSRMSEPIQTPIRLPVVVEEAVNLLKASIPSFIRIEFNAHGPIGHIKGNPTQIHQIIINLCTNAAQAMKGQSGLISISVSGVAKTDADWSQAPPVPDGDYVELCVKDNGMGIDPKDIDKIFDPYFTTRDIGQGSGMGLAIVHGIVKNHQGFIDVESTPGKGTLFRILFPRVAQAKGTETGETVCLPLGRECVLVVDDEKVIADLNRLRLERLNYQVTAVTDSIQALEMFKKEPNTFDLVITDQTMPEMTGIQLAKSMLAIRPDLPIILCSGYDPSLNEQEIKASGIREFIMKPFSREKLVQAIGTVLEKGNTMRTHGDPS
ncbi:MAG: response regulator [Pseudomonadota bacterium]